MKRPDAPCKDCTERNPECHATCALYAAYTVENAKFVDWQHGETHKMLDYYDARCRKRR